MNTSWKNRVSDGVSSLFQPLTYQRGDFVKHFWTVNGHFTENLTIQLDINEGQSVNEPGIRETSHFSCSLDSYNPQCTEFSLAIPAIAISKHAVTNDGLFDQSQQILSAAVATFDLTKQTFVRSTTGNAKTNSHDDIR